MQYQIIFSDALAHHAEKNKDAKLQSMEAATKANLGKQASEHAEKVKETKLKSMEDAKKATLAKSVAAKNQKVQEQRTEKIKANILMRKQNQEEERASYRQKESRKNNVRGTADLKETRRNNERSKTTTTDYYKSQAKKAVARVIQTPIKKINETVEMGKEAYKHIKNIGILTAKLINQIK